MHTVDRRPAYFDGEQIVFCEILPHWQDDYQVALLRESLAEIESDQAKSTRFCRRNNFGLDLSYGYVVVGLKREWVKRKKGRAVHA